MGTLETRSEQGHFELESYNPEDAIRTVRELGARLIEATKSSKQHVKHHFMQEWLDQLIARYRERPGKPIIHLSDLSDQVIPTLSPGVRDLLRPYWENLVSKHSSTWGSTHFRCVWNIMKTGRVGRWSNLRLWRRFSELTGLAIDTLEQYTVAIRAGNSGKTRVIPNPKFPINLSSPHGAKLFGYRGDVTHDTSAFVNRDKTLHEDYKLAIRNTIGEVPFTTSVIHENGVDRTNVGTFITMLTSIGGLDNSQKQKFARNPLPSWIFLTTRETKVACQRALMDAEGSPTRDAVKLGQSVYYPGQEKVVVPVGKRRIRFLALPNKMREDLKKWPPLLLVSASLLLYSMGIESYLAPLGLEETKQGRSAVWMLLIYRGINMRLFERDIGFLSAEKRERLTRMVNLHHPASSLPPPFAKKHS